jgi:hypothetical protein
VATARKMVEVLYHISQKETIFDRLKGKNAFPSADYIGWNARVAAVRQGGRSKP